MRFEVAAAWAMGIGLPLLETLRRRTKFHPLHGYLDDFVAGALLLWAAHATTRGRRSGPVLLVRAWAVLCGGRWSSFFWQLSRADGLDVGGLPNTTVAAIKGGLYAIALTALVVATRRAVALQRPA